MLFIKLITIASILLSAQGETNTGNPSDVELRYPFQPPSPEFCENNRLGSDQYFSIFAPCEFIFYTPTHDLTNITNDDEDSFSCAGVVNSPNERVVEYATNRVFGWPDSCVALGPRCYDLRKHPNLSNFTRIENSEGDDSGDEYYMLNFPSSANFVSVNCSQDFAYAQETLKNLPEIIEPLVGGIIFLGIMISVSIVICAIICCVCCCRGRNRRGYTTVGGVYAGPPVEATKTIVV